LSLSQQWPWASGVVTGPAFTETAPTQAAAAQRQRFQQRNGFLNAGRRKAFAALGLATVGESRFR